jgi:hypothetical protein
VSGACLGPFGPVAFGQKPGLSHMCCRLFLAARGPEDLPLSMSGSRFEGRRRGVDACLDGRLTTRRYRAAREHVNVTPLTPAVYVVFCSSRPACREPSAIAALLPCNVNRNYL